MHSSSSSFCVSPVPDAAWTRRPDWTPAGTRVFPRCCRALSVGSHVNHTGVCSQRRMKPVFFTPPNLGSPWLQAVQMPLLTYVLNSNSIYQIPSDYNDLHKLIQASLAQAWIEPLAFPQDHLTCSVFWLSQLKCLLSSVGICCLYIFLYCMKMKVKKSAVFWLQREGYEHFLQACKKH